VGVTGQHLIEVGGQPNPGVPSRRRASPPRIGGGDGTEGQLGGGRDQGGWKTSTASPDPTSLTLTAVTSGGV
jgi:hypothetical protein